MINLVEEYYILCLHEEKYKIIPSIGDTFQAGLNAAALMELALHKKIKIDDKRRVEVIDPADVGEEILNEALQVISRTEKHHRIGYWVENLYEKPKKLVERLEQILVEKGLTRVEEESRYWLIPSSMHPEINASIRFAIKERLRVLAITNQVPNLRELSMLSLANTTGLAELIFFKDERKLVRRRIYELLVVEAMKDPTAQMIEDIQSVLAEHVEEE